MNFTKDYLESTYEIITPLDNGKENPHTWMVLQKQTKLVFVLKEVSKEAYEIAKKWVMIQHQNLVNVQLVYERENKFYVIEEYVNGTTLQDRIDQEQYMDMEEIVDVIGQLLDGLDMIHNAGIIHRDVTPSNIMITNAGTVKLLDFGISRFHNKEAEYNRDTTILGTVGYAAPEQFGFQQTDVRTDLYSVGVLMNQLMVGKYPNEGTVPYDRMQRMITKATSMNPDDRYSTAKEMKRVLELRGRGPILPGFRTNVIWKKIIAIFAYTIGWFIAAVYCLDALLLTQQDMVKEIISALLVFVVPPLVWGNIYYWDRQIPVIRKLPYPIKFILRVIVGFAIFFFGMELYVGTGG
ncbi:MAG: serine/threonine protein kinase [Lachnospiraceae bacterium]|nr:serine/threonine protein kinase [Lachnospiraceae bacterium]